MFETNTATCDIVFDKDELNVFIDAVVDAWLQTDDPTIWLFC